LGGIHNIQDQRRLGAIIVPNKEEVLLAAKKLSVVDANASDLSKEKMTSLLYKELKKRSNFFISLFFFFFFLYLFIFFFGRGGGGGG
jgi:hypothetical protein